MNTQNICSIMEANKKIIKAIFIISFGSLTSSFQHQIYLKGNMLGNKYFHYENTPIQIHWKFYHQKIENFQIKFFDIFHISAQNIDCGYSLEPPHRGGSNDYPQSMFWAETRKIMYPPVNPSFTI